MVTCPPNLCQAALRLSVTGRQVRFQGAGFSYARQYFRPLVSNRDSVLGMSAWLPIERHNRPAIRQHLRIVGAEVNHRLDGKNVSSPYLRAVSGFSIVGYLRVFM